MKEDIEFLTNLTSNERKHLLFAITRIDQLERNCREQEDSDPNEPKRTLETIEKQLRGFCKTQIFHLASLHTTSPPPSEHNQLQQLKDIIATEYAPNARHYEYQEQKQRLRFGISKLIIRLQELNRDEKSSAKREARAEHDQEIEDLRKYQSKVKDFLAEFPLTLSQYLEEKLEEDLVAEAVKMDVEQIWVNRENFIAEFNKLLFPSIGGLIKRFMEAEIKKLPELLSTIQPMTQDIIVLCQFDKRSKALENIASVARDFGLFGGAIGAFALPNASILVAILIPALEVALVGALIGGTVLAVKYALKFNPLWTLNGAKTTAAQKLSQYIRQNRSLMVTSLVLELRNCFDQVITQAINLSFSQYAEKIAELDPGSEIFRILVEIKSTLEAPQPNL